MISSSHYAVSCSGDIPLEYSGEEQAICAVGLLQPRAGVFLEAIQHVIVLCTTVEVGCGASRDVRDVLKDTC